MHLNVLRTGATTDAQQNRWLRLRSSAESTRHLGAAPIDRTSPGPIHPDSAERRVENVFAGSQSQQRQNGWPAGSR